MTSISGLSVDGDRLLRDGREHRVVSAAVHYFRVHPALWRDRLERVRAMGCNTVETYVAWNFHQPTPDVTDFSGWRDVAAFIRQAGSLGLDVIARPGPYICAEWDFGGLPAWLLADENVRLRCSDPLFLAAVDRWFDELIPTLASLQASAGGPIVAMQVENEYGSYGTDGDYLRHLRDGLVDHGVDCLLFTSDGPEPRMLAHGSLAADLATVNFGSGAQDAFAALRRSRPVGPQICMEFWNGWFDHWGEPHQRRDAEDAAKTLDAILASGASVNLYMGHGGTNFGWWAGANHTGSLYQPTVTSYDYDAPIGEAGELTEKFHLFREVIGNYVTLPDVPLPAPAFRVKPQRVELEPLARLLDVASTLAAPIRRPTPEPMEKLGFSHGLVLYRHLVTGPAGRWVLRIDDIHDVAQVFADGRRIATLYRDAPEHAVELDVPETGVELEILVEPYGRVNYGPQLVDRKGLIGGVTLDRQFLLGWDIHVLPLDDLSALPSGETTGDGPVFHRAEVALEEPADAFLALPGAERVLVWLNGFLLGRLWDSGPQSTLYAPAPLWRAGRNELLALELTGATDLLLDVRDQPDLGPVAAR